MKGAACRRPSINTFYGTPVSVPLRKFVKTASICKISLKSGNRLVSSGQNTTFKTAGVRHLDF